jgi:hypothetical protein
VILSAVELQWPAGPAWERASPANLEIEHVMARGWGHVGAPTSWATPIWQRSCDISVDTLGYVMLVTRN